VCVCVRSVQHVQWGAAEDGGQPQHQRGKLGRRAEGGGSAGAAGPRAAEPDPAQEEGGQDLQQDRRQALHQRQEVGPLLSDWTWKGLSPPLASRTHFWVFLSVSRLNFESNNRKLRI